MRKTIIALWNNPNTGKTETLRALAEMLINEFPEIVPLFPIPISIAADDDFRVVIAVNGRVVGIESQGDPRTNLLERLIELVNNFNCDIIFCTSRIRGETVWAVEHIHENFNYETIWTSTYQVSRPDLTVAANRIKAEHLIDLIQTLGLI